MRGVGAAGHGEPPSLPNELTDGHGVAVLVGVLNVVAKQLLGLHLEGRGTPNCRGPILAHFPQLVLARQRRLGNLEPGARSRSMCYKQVVVLVQPLELGLVVRRLEIQGLLLVVREDEPDLLNRQLRIGGQIRHSKGQISQP